MGAISREMNSAKWFWIAIGYQTLLAYVSSLAIYQVGAWITTGAFNIGTIAAFVVIVAFVYFLVRPERKHA